MPEYQIKNFIGIYIIFLHFLIFMSMAFCFWSGGYSVPQVQTIAEIILPLFVGYCTAVVGHFIDTRYKEHRRSKKFTGYFIFVGFLFPAAFTTLIMVAIFTQAYGRLFDSFEDFKLAVFGVESFFAGNVGRLIYTVFRSDQEVMEVG